MRRDGRDRFKGDDTQCYHPAGVEHRDEPREVPAAVRYLHARWPGIPPGIITWIAEDGVGQKDVAPPDAPRGKELIERATGAIAGQRHAADVSSQPAGSFGDEQETSGEGAVGWPKYACPARHTWAQLAGLRLANEPLEGSGASVFLYPSLKRFYHSTPRPYAAIARDRTQRRILDQWAKATLLTPSHIRTYVLIVKFRSMLILAVDRVQRPELPSLSSGVQMIGKMVGNGLPNGSECDVGSLPGVENLGAIGVAPRREQVTFSNAVLIG